MRTSVFATFKKLIFILGATLLATTSSLAATIGTEAGSPGFSAADILNQNPLSADGLYWIDPDLPGGEDSFQIYADMTSYGGGWSMYNCASCGAPTLFGHNAAINILASDPNTQMRFVGSTFDAYYLGTVGNTLAGEGDWVIAHGESSLELAALYGASWGISSSSYDVYIREASTTAYPAVPIPAAVWLFGSALAGLGWLRRKQTV